MQQTADRVEVFPCIVDAARRYFKENPGAHVANIVNVGMDNTGHFMYAHSIRTIGFIAIRTVGDAIEIHNPIVPNRRPFRVSID